MNETVTVDAGCVTQVVECVAVPISNGLVLISTYPSLAPGSGHPPITRRAIDANASGDIWGEFLVLYTSLGSSTAQFPTDQTWEDLYLVSQAWCISMMHESPDDIDQMSFTRIASKLTIAKRNELVRMLIPDLMTQVSSPILTLSRSSQGTPA